MLQLTFEQGKAWLFEYLMEHYPEIENLIDEHDRFFQTALHFACRTTCLPIVFLPFFSSTQNGV